MAPIALNTSTDPHVGYRPPGTLDVAGAMQPYAGHFGPRQAGHLLRRAGFGGSAAEVAGLTERGCFAAVDALLHPPADAAFSDYPDVTILYGPPGKVRFGTQMWWLDRCCEHVIRWPKR